MRKPVKPGSNFRVLFTKNYVKKSTLFVDLLKKYALFLACYSH